MVMAPARGADDPQAAEVNPSVVVPADENQIRQVGRTSIGPGADVVGDASVGGDRTAGMDAALCRPEPRARRVARLSHTVRRTPLPAAANGSDRSSDRRRGSPWQSRSAMARSVRDITNPEGHFAPIPVASWSGVTVMVTCPVPVGRSVWSVERSAISRERRPVVVQGCACHRGRSVTRTRRRPRQAPHRWPRRGSR